MEALLLFFLEHLLHTISGTLIERVCPPVAAAIPAPGTNFTVNAISKVIPGIGTVISHITPEIQCCLSPLAQTIFKAAWSRRRRGWTASWTALWTACWTACWIVIRTALAVNTTTNFGTLVATNPSAFISPVIARVPSSTYTPSAKVVEDGDEHLVDVVAVGKLILGVHHLHVFRGGKILGVHVKGGGLDVLRVIGVGNSSDGLNMIVDGRRNGRRGG